jgi:hypothetical protein
LTRCPNQFEKANFLLENRKMPEGKLRNCLKIDKLKQYGKKIAYSTN